MRIAAGWASWSSMGRRMLAGAAVLAVLAVGVGSCATTEAPSVEAPSVEAPSAEAPSAETPSASTCPDQQGWPPVGLAAEPPRGVIVVRPREDTLRVTNGTADPITVRFRTWTPLDCAATPPFADLNAITVASLGAVSWGGAGDIPARGPVMGGLEVWSGTCANPCAARPDAFISFVLRPGSP